MENTVYCRVVRFFIFSQNNFFSFDRKGLVQGQLKGLKKHNSYCLCLAGGNDNKSESSSLGRRHGRQSAATHGAASCGAENCQKILRRKFLPTGDNCRLSLFFAFSHFCIRKGKHRHFFKIIW